MVQKFYVNINGDYLGSYDGPDIDNPHAGETEVAPPPPDGRDKWNGTSWDAYLPTANEIKAEANRRIQASGHDWMAAREVSDGTVIPPAIKTYATNIRADSAALEATPVADYKDDSHWTIAP